MAALEKQIKPIHYRLKLILLTLVVTTAAFTLIDGLTEKSYALTGAECVACHDGNGPWAPPLLNKYGNPDPRYTPHFEGDGNMKNEHHYYPMIMGSRSCASCHSNTKVLDYQNNDLGRQFGVCTNCHYPGSTMFNAQDPNEAHEPVHDMTDVPQAMCRGCHDGNVYDEHSGRTGFIDAEGDLNCATCHSSADQNVLDQIALGSTPNNQMIYCADCHAQIQSHPPVQPPNDQCDMCHTTLQPGQLTHELHKSAATDNCSICHSLNPVDCTACHNDHDGTKQNCIYCHGNPPTFGTPQGNDGLVWTPGPTGSTSSGAHDLHVNTQNMGCDTCHFNGMPVTPVLEDYKLQVGFDIPFGPASATSYDGQILFPSYDYEGTNNTTVTTGGSMSCVVYCHSDGTSASTGAQLATPSSAWDTTGPLPCDSCHNYGSPITGPSYTNNYPKANSHKRHVDELGFTCNLCHYETTNNGSSISSTSKHVNGQYDLAPDTSQVVLSRNVYFDYSYDPGGGTCSNISCHIGIWANPTSWGETDLGGNLIQSQGNVCGEVDITINASGGVLPYTYYIDWGDGETYEGPDNSHTHVYSDATPTSNQYDVTWSVRDAAMNTMPISPRTTTVTVYTGNVDPVPNFSVTVNGYEVTITDQSTDADYNTCGHSGPGRVMIDWGDFGSGWQDYGYTLNLTDSPSGQVIGSHTYSPRAGDPTTYNIDYAVYDNVTTYPIFINNTPVTVP